MALSNNSNRFGGQKSYRLVFEHRYDCQNTSVEAIRMAIRNRGIKDGLIFHSDRGIQYACEEFREVIEENRIVQRMSRKANCWHNAVAESFFKTLKAELIYHRTFLDQQSAKL